MAGARYRIGYCARTRQAERNGKGQVRFAIRPAEQLFLNGAALVNQGRGEPIIAARMV